MRENTDVVVAGWVNSRLCVLDELAPSLVRAVLCGSNLKRQVVFAVLAFDEITTQQDVSRPVPRSHEEGAQFATVLRDGSAADIIKAAFGSVPNGLVGALARCQGTLTPMNYVRLYSIFAGGDRRKANALRHLPQITNRHLSMVDALPPVLVDGKILGKLDNRIEAADLADAIACIQRICSAGHDIGLHNAIRTMEPHTSLRSLALRFLRRADKFPPQPLDGLPANPELEPLNTAPKLIVAARRYRNCLRRHLGRVIKGDTAFVEFRKSAVLELRPLSNGQWLLHRVHAKGNETICPDIERAAQFALDAVGIHHVVDGNANPDYDALARISGEWAWGIL